MGGDTAKDGWRNGRTFDSIPLLSPRLGSTAEPHSIPSGVAGSQSEPREVELMLRVLR